MTEKEQLIADLLERVTKFSSSLRSMIRAKLKEDDLDLTTEMLQVLKCLFDKDGINQQEIANTIIKDKASLTYLIDNLTKRKLVKRVEDSNDRRNKLIFLTKKGSELKVKTTEWIKEIYHIAGTNLNMDEIKKSLSVLDKTIQNLEKKV